MVVRKRHNKKKEELRKYLLKYLRERKKLSERSSNYYNSVIMSVYEVTLDKIINKKQVTMYMNRRKMKDVITKEELSAFSMPVTIINIKQYL